MGGRKSESVVVLVNNHPLMLNPSGIRIPPHSVNISVDEVAVFNCTAIATFIRWEADGQPLNNITRSKGFDDTAPIVALNHTTGLHMRTLSVVGSPDTNGTNITCFALLRISSTMFGAAKSEPALILVQGDAENSAYS